MGRSESSLLRLMFEQFTEDDPTGPKADIFVKDLGWVCGVYDFSETDEVVTLWIAEKCRGRWRSCDVVSSHIKAVCWIEEPAKGGE